MDGDVGIVKVVCFSIFLKREVVAVDGRRGAVGQIDAPVEAVEVYDIDIVTLLVKERVESLGGAEGYIMFRGVATADDGNGSFGCCDDEI